MLFVLYSLPDRAVLATASTEEGLPSPPAESGVVGLEEWDEVPAGSYRWNPQILNYAIPVVGTYITRETFMDRVGSTAFDAIMTTAWLSTATGAAVRSWLLRFVVTPDVNLSDQRVIDGVDSLIAHGLVPSENRDAILYIGG